MYKDRQSGRTLMRDGSSMVDSFSLARKILFEDIDISACSVISDFHSNTYDYLNKTAISKPIDEIFVEPTESHVHEEEDILLLHSLMKNSDRYNDSPEFRTRIDEEIEFFSKTNNILFVLYCVQLIQSFQEKGIVWGVGRGSSCASLVFYILGITDVNPIQYNIKFYEMSKEM